MRAFPFDDPTSSFYDYLTSHYPHLVQFQQHGMPPAQLSRPESTLSRPVDFPILIPKGTTILALCYQDGALIGGDRRATEGFQISARRIEKVYKADDYSAIAIAGAAGPCIEMARLFQIELEHYEKLEGETLSTEGKGNKLSQMVKGNLPMAIQGLIVIPIFVSYDLKRLEGRIFKYDITGGRYEETDYYATGSGGKDARSAMKKLFKRDMTEDEAISLALESLYDAAEEDVATAGPDLLRDIYPTVKTVTKQGLQDVTEKRIKQLYNTIIERRRSA